MSFWSRLLGSPDADSIDSYDAAQRVLPEPFEPFFSTGGIPVADPGYPLEGWLLGQRSAIELMWRTQPEVRKVVDFVARNIASIPLHVFERVADNERRRITYEPLPDLLAQPRPRVGSYRFWHGVLSDGLLYDRWCVIRVTDPATGAMRLAHVPSWRLRMKTNAMREVDTLLYWNGDDRDPWVEIPMDGAIFDHGYAPMSAGLSPIATLREILHGSAEAIRYRNDMYANGARVPGYISRPPGAEWGDGQRARFVEAMRAYRSDGARSGAMPLLEDGMKMEEFRAFSPQDANDLEGRRLTGVEVASAFHIAPELVGAREGTYSNVDAFRESLYRDSLGPYIRAWVDALNAQLTPEFSNGRRLYIEDNVESKLRGSFTEQAKIGQASVGAPSVTRNEWRARMNLPPLPGGDDLVTPLNVTVGGQASPQDSGTQNEKAARVQTKAASGDWEAKHREVLGRFFSRQRRVVLSSLGAKAADWWDADRWNGELADDLYRLSVETVNAEAAAALERVGGSPGEFEVGRALAFLKAAAERRAVDINETTLAEIEAALADAENDEPRTEVAGAVFEKAETSRLEQMATTLVTATAGFAAVEAVKQTSTSGTKTWVTGRNPRPTHAALNGQTVPIGEPFSNGMQYPGDGSSADENANCNCTIDVSLS